MSAETEFLRGKLEEADGAMVRRPKATFNRRGNDVWADRSGRVYAPGMEGGGLRDMSSPVTGNGMGNLSRLVGGKRRGGASHKAKTGQVTTTSRELSAEEKAENARRAAEQQKQDDAYRSRQQSNMGTSYKDQWNMQRHEANKQVFSRVGDLFVKALPPGLSTAGVLALTLNPYSEYYIPPEQRSIGAYARLGLTNYAAGKAMNMAGKAIMPVASRALSGLAGEIFGTAEGEAAAAARNAAARAANPPRASTGQFYPPPSGRPAPINWAGRPAPPAIEQENWLAWSRANPPPPPSTPYPYAARDAARAAAAAAATPAAAPRAFVAQGLAGTPGRVGSQAVQQGIKQLGGRRGRGILPGTSSALSAPLLRGPMNPSGVGKVYNVMSSPDYETVDLMREGSALYTGGGKMTEHEKRAMHLAHEAQEMGMSLDQHLKAMKIPAAQRRTIIKRADKAMSKSSGAKGGAKSGAKRSSARGQAISRLMKEQGMTLGEASKHLAGK